MADDADENLEAPKPEEESNENNDEQEKEIEQPKSEEKDVEEMDPSNEAEVAEVATAEDTVPENQSNDVPATEKQPSDIPAAEDQTVDAPGTEKEVEGEPDNENVEAVEAPVEGGTEVGAAEGEAVEGGEAEAAEGGETEEGAKVEGTADVGEAVEGEGEAADGQTGGEKDPAEVTEGEPASSHDTETFVVTEGSNETESKPSVEEGAEENRSSEKGAGELPVLSEENEGEGAERPESQLRVGEKLSRENSLKEEPEEGEAGAEASGPAHLDASSPRAEEEAAAMAAVEAMGEEGEDMEEEEEEEETVFDRELLIEKYRQAHAERQQLIQQNNVLQTKLAEYFRKKKADTESSGKSEMEKSIADQEQRYLKYIANLEDLRRQYSELQEEYLVQIADLKAQCGEKQEKVDGETSKFMEFKKQVGLKSINSRSGKAIQPKELEGFLGVEHRKETEVVQVRLKNIKLLNGLRKEELALKSKEELAEGLHLIDFEQLKIENQTYNEKIEERNEELLKLRKKITSTVQVLTHLKEKLQFVLQENQGQRNRLNDVDGQVARERDLLTRTKQSRDALRIDNNRLRQNCGLLGNEPLLRNFEDCVDTVDDKKKRLDLMRMEHAELTLNYNGLKRKIEQAKSASAVGNRL